MERTVVIIGGGYGGTLAAKELDADANVILIDPREGFVNAAGSLRALTRPDWAPNAFFPFGTLLARGRVIRDRAVSVDPKGVTLASGQRVEADYLVLATGSGYSYPAKPNPEANDIAQQLDDLRKTHKELSGAGRVLILGAGPVGLELAWRGDRRRHLVPRIRRPDQHQDFVAYRFDPAAGGTATRPTADDQAPAAGETALTGGRARR